MHAEPLQFERDYDLPPIIVWDAFVDQDLVEGWLAVAHLEARLGGEYWLEWQGPVSGTTSAQITVFEPVRRIALAAGGDILDFRFTEIEGGTRGSATTVALTVTGFGDDQPARSARWRTALEQLEGLLRGHPVDWPNWQRDHGASWARYLAEATPSGSANSPDGA